MIKNKKTFLLHVNGYLFYKNNGVIGVGETAYWRCKKCSARATTRGDQNNFDVVKISNVADHFHAPNSGIENSGICENKRQVSKLENFLTFVRHAIQLL